MPMLRRHEPNDATGRSEHDPDEPSIAGGVGIMAGAEDHGHATASLLGRALVTWTRLCLRAPVVILLGAVLSAVAAGAYTAQSLGYKVSRVDLLDPKSDYNKLWIDYIQEFGEDDDAVVVVEGPSRDCVVKVLEELSREVAQNDALFRSVLHEVDLSKIRAKGLHYLSPADLAEIDRFIERTEPILAGGWTHLKVATMVGGLAGQMVAGGPPVAERKQAPGSVGELQESPLAALERYSESLLAGLEAGRRPADAGATGYVSPWPRMPESLSTLRDLSSQHLLAKEGRLGFVLLRLAKSKDGFA
ncbi:MAG: hypothetical protein ACKOK8_12690, partial [Planctomycetia bacterium]